MSEPIFLTKLELDAAFCHKHRIKDTYSLHRVVYSMFPKENDPGRILFVDRGAAKGIREILVQSRIMPDMPEDVPASIRKISEKFFAAGKYRFEILLNPVKCDSKSQKRLPVTGQLPLLNYFSDRMGKWGFEADLNYLEVFSLPSIKFTCNDRQYRFNRAKFRGILTVTDMDLFRQNFVSGIGHGKAFGFGLMQLVPIQ